MSRKKLDGTLARALRRQRHLARAAHFAAGGTAAEWRGAQRIEPDHRKEADRRQCRGRAKLEEEGRPGFRFGVPDQPSNYRPG